MRVFGFFLGCAALSGCGDDPRFDASVDGCFLDEDGDGYGDLSVTGDCSDPAAVPVAGDCDDTNSLIGPEAVEVCDEIDNDCDGGIDEDAADAVTLYVDADGDGYGGSDFAELRCDGDAGWVANSEDCDDLESSVYPDAVELCGDGIDNDCDGQPESDCVLELDGVAYYGDRDDEGVGTVAAGDLNGDGIDDVLIGAYASSNGNGLINDGAAYIFFGSHQASAVLDEADVVIQGAVEEKDTLGWGVSTPGDIDGDGKLEFFATPTGRNKANASQPGEMVMYRYDGSTYVRTVVDPFGETHAKEILTADLDGDGTSELFSVIEAETDAQKNVVKPVEIRQYTLAADGTFTHASIATIDDRQTRFLIPGDFDGDGKTDLVAAAMKTGLWYLTQGADGWEKTLIDAVSSGFEHTSYAADLDGDGTLELYVAADNQQELKAYRYNAEKKNFDKELLGRLADNTITWNITTGSM